MQSMLLITMLGLLAGPFLLGCGSDGSIQEANPLSAQAAKDIPVFPGPDGFVSEITNPYLAFSPGRTFHYRSETPEGIETNSVEITHQTKTILGVATTVVHDRVYLNGSLTEDTFDWYAQDEDGNVWYFGEDSKEILDGQVVSTEGSWEAGKEGPPGIIMLAEPELGLSYKQEAAKGIAEDMGKVVSLTAQVQVSYGSFDGCLQTAEWSLIESGPRDYKFYAPGVGLVLELLNRGKNQERVELISID